MYAATQWTPLPTGHGPLGLASQKKGQVTPTVREETHHQQPNDINKSHTAYPQYGFRLWLTTHKIFLIVKALMLIKSRRITLLLLEFSGEKLYRSSVF